MSETTGGGQTKVKESERVEDIGSKLEELVDDEVKEKVKQELEEIDTYSAGDNYWPG